MLKGLFHWIGELISSKKISSSNSSVDELGAKKKFDLKRQVFILVDTFPHLKFIIFAKHSQENPEFCFRHAKHTLNSRWKHNFHRGGVCDFLRDFTYTTLISPPTTLNPDWMGIYFLNIYFRGFYRRERGSGKFYFLNFPMM